MRAQRLLPILAAAGGIALVASPVAHAQQLGTIYLDFDGESGTAQGTVTPLDAGVFPGLTSADTPALRAAILQNVQAEYSPFSISITDVLPASGPFTRVVVGNTGSNPNLNGSLGVADEIDFRNKRADNVVSVLAQPHVDPAPRPGNYTVADAALDVGHSASHELGHVLGLIHTDVVSTFEAAGGGPAGRAAVNANELMAAATLEANRFNNLSFGQYSQTKLRIAENGVNVQPELGPAVFTTAFAPDPGRTGDAGNTTATGTLLLPDANGRAVALGTIGGADTADVFTFAGVAGQHVTAEAFSRLLRDIDGSGPFRGRVGDFMDPVVELIDALGNLVAGEEYNRLSDIDGVGGQDFGADSLLFDFSLPATGLYGLRVTARTPSVVFDGVGHYELLVVPEPGVTTLLATAAAAALTLRTRTRRPRFNGDAGPASLT